MGVAEFGKMWYKVIFCYQLLDKFIVNSPISEYFLYFSKRNWAHNSRCLVTAFFITHGPILEVASFGAHQDRASEFYTTRSELLTFTHLDLYWSNIWVSVPLLITRSMETGHGNNSDMYSFVCIQRYKNETRGERLRCCITYRKLR